MAELEGLQDSERRDQNNMIMTPDEDMNSAPSNGLLLSNNNNNNNNEVEGDRLGIEAIDIVPSSVKAYIHSDSFREFLACLIFPIAGLILEAGIIEPRRRPMPFVQLESTGEYIVNQVFNETLDGVTVPTLALFFYAYLLPAAIQGLLCYFSGNVKLLHRTLCVYFTAAGLTLLLTDAIKLYVGYLRPIFYDVCQPDDAYEECTSGDDTEIRLSFPSGHASSAFCGLSLLSFFLERQYGVSSLRILIHEPSSSSHNQVSLGYHRPLGFKRIVSILCYAPMTIAGFIATSRIVDNKHHPADVVGGSVLGTAIAALVHSIWFPSWPCLDTGSRG